jgi:aspartyl/glutamyl-tRNA(Asn/Gln) amidotransferase C subunit
MIDKDFDRLLEVCRLNLNAEEKARIMADVDEILQYFNAIEAIECDEFEESHHPVLIPDRLRDDVVIDFDNVNGILRNTKIHRFYVVGPKI